MQISVNGMQPLPKEECTRNLAILLEKISACTTKDTSYVLHIDEAHSWSVPFDFVRKHGDELVEVCDCKHYFFIALTEVLETLRAEFIRIKIIVTGTNVFLDRFLRFSSNVSNVLCCH